MSDTAELSGRLAKLDACAVSDALDKLGLPGVASGLFPLTGPVRIAGPVATLELGSPADQAPTRHLGTATILAARPRDVIVVAHGGRTDCAGWGGNLSRAARTVGIAGVIVDGACRDIDEARELGFPVFARAGTPRTARGRAAERSHGEEIRVGELCVRPGDLVIADSSGVVFVPRERAALVIEEAEVIARKEAAMAARIDAGEPVDRVMGASYETMLRPKAAEGAE